MSGAISTPAAILADYSDVRSVHDRKDRRIGADGESEGDNDRGGESQVCAQFGASRLCDQALPKARPHKSPQQ
jgi:hypothetical protein